MSSMVPLVVAGGAGRMGRAVIDVAGRTVGFSVVATVVRALPNEARPGDPPSFTDLEGALQGSPDAVVLVFTASAAAPGVVTAVSERDHALVVGTTGMGGAGDRAIARAAERVAVVEAPNTSPGMALLRRALRAVLAASGPEWDVSILDRHHRHKKDSPSGTAVQLKSLVEESGRDGDVVSLRQGGVVGEHSVFVSTENEELVFLHRAFNRSVFARGALLAAAFAAGAKAGRYTMDDVVESVGTRLG